MCHPWAISCKGARSAASTRSRRERNYTFRALKKLQIVIKRFSPQIQRLSSRCCELKATLLLCLNLAEKEIGHKTLFYFCNYTRAPELSFPISIISSLGLSLNCFQESIKKKKKDKIFQFHFFFLFEWPLAERG